MLKIKVYKPKVDVKTSNPNTNFPEVFKLK